MYRVDFLPRKELTKYGYNEWEVAFDYLEFIDAKVKTYKNGWTKVWLKNKQYESFRFFLKRMAFESIEFNVTKQGGRKK